MILCGFHTVKLLTAVGKKAARRREPISNVVVGLDVVLNGYFHIRIINTEEDQDKLRDYPDIIQDYGVSPVLSSSQLSLVFSEEIFCGYLLQTLSCRCVAGPISAV